jgi:hypothetical protein
MTRVGDRERGQTVLALQRHYVDGRLDDTELSERLEVALRARRRSELQVALRELPRRIEVERLVERLRHGALVALLTLVWLMLSASLCVAFVAWVAARGVSLGALIAFPVVWIASSALLYRRTASSRRQLTRTLR